MVFPNVEHCPQMMVFETDEVYKREQMAQIGEAGNHSICQGSVIRPHS